ncbi:hypothetical protein BKA93DRAFT_753377 [Sparassis latifolia]
MACANPRKPVLHSKLTAPLARLLREDLQANGWLMNNKLLSYSYLEARVFKVLAAYVQNVLHAYEYRSYNCAAAVILQTPECSTKTDSLPQIRAMPSVPPAHSFPHQGQVFLRQVYHWKLLQFLQHWDLIGTVAGESVRQREAAVLELGPGCIALRLTPVICQNRTRWNGSWTRGGARARRCNGATRVEVGWSACVSGLLHVEQMGSSHPVVPVN